MTKKRGDCKVCDKYRKQHHNFCRMCGNELNPGYVPYVRIALAYLVNEKYCGYCGGPKHECECVTPSRKRKKTEPTDE
jgi:hypothetical protein